MGDMGDLFNDLKEIKRTRGQQRAADAQSLLPAIRALVVAKALEWGRQGYVEVDDNGTWNLSGFGRKKRQIIHTNIQFYPTKGTWQVQGRMYHGGVRSFERWLEKNLGA